MNVHNLNECTQSKWSYSLIETNTHLINMNILHFNDICDMISMWRWTTIVIYFSEIDCKILKFMNNYGHSAVMFGGFL